MWVFERRVKNYQRGRYFLLSCINADGFLGKNNPKEKYVSTNAKKKRKVEKKIQLNYLLSTRRSSNFLTKKKHYSSNQKKKRKEKKAETEERLVFALVLSFSTFYRTSITTDLVTKGDE